MSAAVAAPPELTQTAESIANTLIDAGGAAWATMTGAEFAHHPGDTKYDAPQTLAASLGKTLVTRMDWTGDREGALYLLMAAEGAQAIIAHMMALMMGGPADVAGTALDAEGLDAYGEVANNFSGQGAQALRGSVGGNIKFVIKNTTLAEDAAAVAAALGDAPLALSSGTFNLGDGGPYAIAVAMAASCTGVEIPGENPDDAAPPGVPEAVLAEFTPENIEHALKVKVPLIVVLAETKLRMEFVQEWAPGSIIEFRKQSGEILDVCANNVKMARGEVVTTNKHFGVQIRQVLDPRVRGGD